MSRQVMPIKILYEDNHLLVVEKPVNIPTQADASGDPDLLSLLKEDLKIRYQKPGNVYLGLVHRLDRPVGGVMVFGKTSKGAARLAQQIREGGFQRRYLGVVEGYPRHLSGSLRHYLLKDKRRNLVRVVRPHEEGAQEAILDYEVLAMSNSQSLVRIHLRTGRSHQIRVQLAEMGHPLWGDRRYGQNQRQQGTIALWAEGISFRHPTTRELLDFSRRPPQSKPWTAFDLEL